MAANAAHPEIEVLDAYNGGRLDPHRHTAVESHVLECDSCWRYLSGLPDDPLISLVRESWHADPNLATAWGGPKVCPITNGKSAPDLPAALTGHPRYQVLELCGAGGMGIVYRAEHRLMGREVALKFVRPDLLRKSSAVERFRREVRNAAALSHPNIVAAHDAEEAEGVHFLAMEFVAGQDLGKAVASRGPLPVTEACDYIRQAALGLSYAFDRGMVHRDIKPHNLMLTCNGQVKILDFGLSKFASEAAPEVPRGETATSSSNLTHASTIIGTPDYVAPEQTADATSAGIQADIYSLGRTLYFLLAGRPPFAGASVADKFISRAGHEPTPIEELRPDLPPGLADVLRRMTAKQPDDRYQTPAEVALALEPFLASAAGTAAFHRAAQRRRRGVVAAGVAAAGLIATAAAGIGRYATPSEGTVTIVADSPDVQVIVERLDGTAVKLDSLSRREADLASGAYTVRLAGQADGFEIVRPQSGSFSLGRGETELIRVRRVNSRRNGPPDPIAALRSLGARIGRTDSGGIVVDIRAAPAFTDDKVDLIAALPNVADVTLENLPVTDAGLERLRPLVGLQRLILNDSDVSGRVLEILAALPLRRSVSNIGLRGLSVSDDDLTHIGRFDRLYKVDLSGTNVTDEGLKHFVGTRVQVIDARKSQITSDGAARLRAEMPSVLLQL